VTVGAGGGLGGVVPGAGLSFGVVKPAALGKAMGGSKAPPKSGAQPAHSGISEVKRLGIDSCGVQMLVRV
jgi:hypothetical protein